MKKILLILMTVVISLTASAQGIIFEENHDLNVALEKAKAENKMVFIDAYAEWCGPCKVMARDIFPQPEVGEYFNTHFVNMKLDMEKPENRYIAQKYEVRAYPTYLFLSGEGELVHKGLGSMPADRFIAVAQQAADDDNNLMAIQRKLDSGDRSLTTIKKFIDQNPYDSSVGKLLNDYFGSLSESEIMTNENWDLFNKHVNDFNSPAYQYVLSNRDAVADFVGKENLDNKILGTMSSVYYTNSRAVDNDSQTIRDDEVKAIDNELFQKAVANVDMSIAYRAFMSNKEDKTSWNNFVAAVEPYLSTYKNAEQYNRFSWLIFENYKQFDDAASLAKAVRWAEQANELSPGNSHIVDTYARLLSDSGKKSVAKKLVKKGVKTAKKAGNDKDIEILTETMSYILKK